MPEVPDVEALLLLTPALADFVLPLAVADLADFEGAAEVEAELPAAPAAAAEVEALAGIAQHYRVVNLGLIKGIDPSQAGLEEGY